MPIEIQDYDVKAPHQFRGQELADARDGPAGLVETVPEVGVTPILARARTARSRKHYQIKSGVSWHVVRLPRFPPQLLPRAAPRARTSGGPYTVGAAHDSVDRFATGELTEGPDIAPSSDGAESRAHTMWVTTLTTFPCDA